jgi:hypothetical protein
MICLKCNSQAEERWLVYSKFWWCPTCKDEASKEKPPEASDKTSPPRGTWRDTVRAYHSDPMDPVPWIPNTSLSGYCSIHGLYIDDCAGCVAHWNGDKDNGSTN